MVVSHALLGAAIMGVFLSQSTVAITACLVLAGIATGQISVNIFAVAQIFGGARASGGWIGVQNTLGNISGIVGPILTGVIVDRLGGYDWAFAAAAGVAVAGTLLWALVVPPIREINATS